jgi:hypothetical protein
MSTYMNVLLHVNLHLINTLINIIRHVHGLHRMFVSLTHISCALAGMHACEFSRDTTKRAQPCACSWYACRPTDGSCLIGSLATWHTSSGYAPPDARNVSKLGFKLTLNCMISCQSVLDCSVQVLKLLIYMAVGWPRRSERTCFGGWIG